MHWPIRQVPKALEGGPAEIPLLSEHDFNRGGPLKRSVQRGTAFFGVSKMNKYGEKPTEAINMKDRILICSSCRINNGAKC